MLLKTGALSGWKGDGKAAVCHMIRLQVSLVESRRTKLAGEDCVTVTAQSGV
jgi:hypothetical protein